MTGVEVFIGYYIIRFAQRVKLGAPVDPKQRKISEEIEPITTIGAHL